MVLNPQECGLFPIVPQECGIPYIDRMTFRVCVDILLIFAF